MGEQKRQYVTRREDIDREIEAFARKYSDPETMELFRQILTTVMKMDLDRAEEVDVRLINIALKELRHSFKIFSKYRDVPKVTLWGSARSSPNSAEYKMAQEFARRLTEEGFMVITGGGRGVMEAGNRGAGGKSFGVNINLPRIQPANPYLAKGEKLIEFRYFFTRKLVFVKESAATALFPGGFGTMDEGFEILTLFQTGKTAPRPIVMLEPPHSHFWRSWLSFVKKELLRPGYISKDDLNIFQVVRSVEQGVEEIVNYYRVYHSVRFVGPQTIIRLKKYLPPSALAELNRDFSDLLVSGKIEECGATSEEARDKDLTDLPRLALNYDRHNFGRLNEMIRRINEF